eukprot:scpid27106/ scgid3779/ 
MASARARFEVPGGCDLDVDALLSSLASRGWQAAETESTDDELGESARSGLFHKEENYGEDSTDGCTSYSIKVVRKTSPGPGQGAPASADSFSVNGVQVRLLMDQVCEVAISGSRLNDEQTMDDRAVVVEKRRSDPIGNGDTGDIPVLSDRSQKGAGRNDIDALHSGESAAAVPAVIRDCNGTNGIPMNNGATQMNVQTTQASSSSEECDAAQKSNPKVATKASTAYEAKQNAAVAGIVSRGADSEADTSTVNGDGKAATDEAGSSDAASPFDGKRDGDKERAVKATTSPSETMASDKKSVSGRTETEDVSKRHTLPAGISDGGPAGNGCRDAADNDSKQQGNCTMPTGVSTIHQTVKDHSGSSPAAILQQTTGPDLSRGKEADNLFPPAAVHLPTVETAAGADSNSPTSNTKPVDPALQDLEPASSSPSPSAAAAAAATFQAGGRLNPAERSLPASTSRRSTFRGSVGTSRHSHSPAPPPLAQQPAGAGTSTHFVEPAGEREVRENPGASRPAEHSDGTAADSPQSQAHAQDPVSGASQPACDGITAAEGATTMGASAAEDATASERETAPEDATMADGASAPEDATASEGAMASECTTARVPGRDEPGWDGRTLQMPWPSYSGAKFRKAHTLPEHGVDDGKAVMYRTCRDIKPMKTTVLLHQRPLGNLEAPPFRSSVDGHPVCFQDGSKAIVFQYEKAAIDGQADVLAMPFQLEAMPRARFTSAA